MREDTRDGVRGLCLWGKNTSGKHDGGARTVHYRVVTFSQAKRTFTPTLHEDGENEVRALASDGTI